MHARECSDHDAAVLNGMLASTKIAKESLETLKAENFGSYDARLLFRLIGDMHKGKDGAREQTWSVLQRMKWTLPGDTDGTFSGAISRCKAAKDRDRHVRKRLEYVGKLPFIHQGETDEMLAEAWTVIEELGKPNVAEKEGSETVSAEARQIAAQALRPNQAEAAPQRQAESTK